MLLTIVLNTLLVVIVIVATLQIIPDPQRRALSSNSPGQKGDVSYGLQFLETEQTWIFCYKPSNGTILIYVYIYTHLPHIPANREHKTLNRATLGGLGIYT